MNYKAHVPCNFNCIVENDGLLQVTGSRLHCKSGRIAETVKH